MKFIIPFLLFILIGCSSNDDSNITEDPCINQGFSIGLIVKVLDIVTGEFIENDITVKATKGSSTYTLQLGTDGVTGEKNYFGIYMGQEGTYRVTVISSIYEYYISEPITIEVSEDGCTLITEYLEINLQPN
jgi:hypothetical protein